MKRAIDLVYKVLVVIILTLTFVTCLNLMQVWEYDEVKLDTKGCLIKVCDQHDYLGRQTCRVADLRTEGIAK